MVEEVQNNSESQDKDLGKFEYQKGYSLGCREGYHDFNQNKTRLEVVDNQTMVVMECIRCGSKISKIADLGINDLIQEYNNLPGLPKQSETYEPPKTEIKEDNREEFWKKLRGQ